MVNGSNMSTWYAKLGPGYGALSHRFSDVGAHMIYRWSFQNEKGDYQEVGDVIGKSSPLQQTRGLSEDLCSLKRDYSGNLPMSIAPLDTNTSTRTVYYWIW